MIGGINPLEHSWLLAKLIALVLYVYLGNQVIKRRGSRARQWLSYVLALVVFTYMLGVALTKNSWLFL